MAKKPGFVVFRRKDNSVAGTSLQVRLHYAMILK
jgi:hypothetical protein